MDMLGKTDEELLLWAVKIAVPKRKGRAYRWVAVMDTFGVGSTLAHNLCYRADVDPYDMVKK